MDEGRFWAIIEACPLAKDERGQEQQVESLKRALRSLPLTELAAFNERMQELWSRANRWELWAAAYVINGGCSDDGFMDFRSWLISRGRRTYESAIADADALADHAYSGDYWTFEEFVTTPWEVYEGRTGAECPQGMEFPSEPEGRPWEEDDDSLRRVVPRLCQKFLDGE